MKIRNIFIPEKDEIQGLKEVRMNNLGSIVVLAGKNGSGKTRLFRMIKDLTHINRNIPSHQAGKGVQIETEPIDHPLIYIDLVPTSTGLTRSTYEEIALKFNNYEQEHKTNHLTQYLIDFRENTLAVIQFTLNNYHESQGKDQKILDEYESLINLFKQIFSTQTTLERIDPISFKIFDRIYVDDELSFGQKILLQFCVALFKKKTNLIDSIIFLDEPETHLHPEVLKYIIEHLIKVATTSQLWIATHSIPLLSLFDDTDIWFLEDGIVKGNGGKIAKNVLESLLGENEEDRFKLQNFVSLPDVLALSQYSAECLISAKPIDTFSNDPQSKMISKVIDDNFLKLKGNVKILDFGAGRCRVLANIFENFEGSKEVFTSQYDYVAYDKIEKEKLEERAEDIRKASENIKLIYNEEPQRLFFDENELIEKYKAVFDLALMCNVLHEISPEHWMSIFSKGQLLDKLITPNGFTLIVENHEMIIGEKAHDYGFIVLDTESLCILFNVNQSEIIINTLENKKHVKAHLIKKEDFISISENSIIKAIQNHKALSLKQIKYLQKEDHNFINGKKYGFWLSQLANCELYLTDFLSD